MSSGDSSVWLLTFIATLAGVVGAAATTIQVLQARQRRSPANTTQSIKVPARGQAKQGHLPRSRTLTDANQINENVLYLLSFSLAAVFFELLAWLIFVIAGIQPHTIPAYIVFAISGAHGDHVGRSAICSNPVRNG
jgi:hypothetical protein